MKVKGKRQGQNPPSVCFAASSLGDGAKVKVKGKGKVKGKVKGQILGTTCLFYVDERGDRRFQQPMYQEHKRYKSLV